jgi:5-methyltetrahydrofolate--homocysteine methyltransferase
MLIVGEKINSSNASVLKTIENRDDGMIVRLARRQVLAGAAYIDVNAGIFNKDEADCLRWIIIAIQDKVDVKFSIDTINAKALESALVVNKNGKPLVNSITAQKSRFDSFFPLIKEYGASVAALCADESGPPNTVGGRMRIAEYLVEKLLDNGVDFTDIFIDPLVLPVVSDANHGRLTLDTIRALRERWPQIHIICGLSNISYGLPSRRLMNRAFLAAAVAAGLDCAILDPLDHRLISSVYASEALFGADPDCVEYIKKYREGHLSE